MAGVEGRVALVTGAGSKTGIGFAAARTLAQGGAMVALTSTTDRIHERVKVLQAEGARVKGYLADLMFRDQVVDLVASVVRDFGCIEILVNNAGMVQVGKEESFVPMAELQPDEWDDSIGRNLTTCFNVTHTVLPHMIKNSW